MADVFPQLEGHELSYLRAIGKAAFHGFLTSRLTLYRCHHFVCRPQAPNDLGGQSEESFHIQVRMLQCYAEIVF